MCLSVIKGSSGEQLKTNLQSVFSDARLTDSLLVIENVQDLPVSADEPTIIVACLASFLRSFPGVCVLCGACATDSSHRLHPLLKRLLRFTLHLPAMGQKQVGTAATPVVFFRPSCCGGTLIDLNALKCSPLFRCAARCAVEEVPAHARASGDRHQLRRFSPPVRSLTASAAIR